MTREELQLLSVSELRTVAKEQKISGRWDMNKEQLIDAVVGNVEKQEVPAEEVVEVNKAEEEVTVTSETDSVVEEQVQTEEVQVDVEGKKKYLETINRGTLVAFMVDGRCKSAMVMERNIAKQKLKVETRSKVQYVISFSDVVWVKTSNRWPRGVYELLKGGKPNEAAEYTRK